MINLTDMDYRFAIHEARVKRIGAHGWKWEVQEAATARHRRSMTTITRQVRRNLGEALVLVGGWVGGTLRDRAFSSAGEASSTLDAVR